MSSASALLQYYDQYVQQTDKIKKKEMFMNIMNSLHQIYKYYIYSGPNNVSKEFQDVFHKISGISLKPEWVISTIKPNEEKSDMKLPKHFILSLRKILSSKQKDLFLPKEKLQELFFNQNHDLSFTFIDLLLLHQRRKKIIKELVDNIKCKECKKMIYFYLFLNCQYYFKFKIIKYIQFLNTHKRYIPFHSFIKIIHIIIQYLDYFIKHNIHILKSNIRITHQHIIDCLVQINKILNQIQYIISIHI